MVNFLSENTASPLSYPIPTNSRFHIKSIEVALEAFAGGKNRLGSYNDPIKWNLFLQCIFAWNPSQFNQACFYA